MDTRAQADNLRTTSHSTSTCHMSLMEPPGAEVIAIARRMHEWLIQSHVSEAQGTNQRTGDAVTQVLAQFRELTQALEALTRAQQRHDYADAVSLLRKEHLPYVLMGQFSGRAFCKPRGYAGDAQTIDLIYENSPSGYIFAGKLIDQAYLDLPASRAVRNRRALLAGEILRAVASTEQARVASLACGPAREWFDTMDRFDAGASPTFTCIDLDPLALESVRRSATARSCNSRTTTLRANMVRVCRGRQTLVLKPQHLIYSIGLIDYLADEVVVELLDWIFDRLEPGGRVILGNFHPANPCKAVMEHLLDWHLIHRDEDDMNRLFMSSKFRSEAAIQFEDEGINLFASATRCSS